MKQMKKSICIALVLAVILSFAGCAANKPVSIEPFAFTEDEEAVVQLFTQAEHASAVRFRVAQGSNITGGDFSLELFEYGQPTTVLIDSFPAFTDRKDREYSVLCAVQGSTNPRVRLLFHGEDTLSSSTSSLGNLNEISAYSYSQQNKPIEAKPGDERILAVFSMNSTDENGESNTYVYDIEELENDISLLHSQEYAVVLKCKFFDE